MLYSKIEGAGRPLLILHGFLGMSDNWKTLGMQFATEGFEVHLLDLRNHGRSFHAEEFSYDLMAQDILEYCNGHNLTNIDMIGHSMGENCDAFATLYPEMVDKLIIADIAPKFYPQHHQSILGGLNAVDFSKKPSRSEVKKSLPLTYVGTRQF
jgi:pimeloyl-ACP methyl ester carboxylesterase